jgi:hypothetical protein
MSEFQTVNYTIVVFNDKLKSLYDYIHENHIDLVDTLTDMVRSKDSIRELRRVFKKNKDKLDLTENIGFSKPDYFALITGLTSDYKNYNSWEEVIAYYNDIEKHFSFFTNEHEEHHFTDCNVVERMNIINDTSGNNVNSTCICGHVINQICILKRDNQNKLIVGIDCVKKNIIKNDKKHILYKKLKRIKKKLKKEKQIIKETKEEYEKLISEFRKCNDCNKYNISINEPSYKKICLECFKSKNKPKTLVEKMKTHKQCVNCNEYKVKKEYERMKYCWDCTKQCSNPDCVKRILAKYSLCFNCK